MQVSGNCTPIPHYLPRPLKMRMHHRFLNHILNREEGSGREKGFTVSARHWAGLCAYISPFDPHSDQQEGQLEKPAEVSGKDTRSQSSTARLCIVVAHHISCCRIWSPFDRRLLSFLSSILIFTVVHANKCVWHQEKNYTNNSYLEQVKQYGVYKKIIFLFIPTPPSEVNAVTTFMGILPYFFHIWFSTYRHFPHFFFFTYTCMYIYLQATPFNLFSTK